MIAFESIVSICIEFGAYADSDTVPLSKLIDHWSPAGMPFSVNVVCNAVLLTEFDDVVFGVCCCADWNSRDRCAA